MNATKVALKGSNGLFLVNGSGFTAATIAKASQLTQAEAQSQIACLANVGLKATIVPLTTSYAVVYIRAGEGVRLLAGQGKAPANTAAGQVDPSKRRFATEDEAIQHGSQFRRRRANRGDAEGSAKHEGFFLVTTNDAVNAAINWKTGLTNPV